MKEAPNESENSIQKLRDELENSLIAEIIPFEWEEEKTSKVKSILKKTSVIKAQTASIPMVCRGSRCQPAGTMVKTGNRGYVAIEELRPSEDQLVVWDFNNNAIRGGWPNGNRIGYDFTLHSKTYSGTLVKIQTDESKLGHSLTSDHICVARWIDHLIEGKFAVYLMRKGSFWRVGQTKLLTINKKNKRKLGLNSRLSAEKGDDLWLLGTYDSLTEALLAEEEYSLFFQTPKSLFLATDRPDKKDNGMYRWVTQSQLNEHHERLSKPLMHYATKLGQLNLDIRYPILTSDRSRKYSIGHNRFNIRACNLVSELMEVPTENTYPKTREKGAKVSCHRPKWEKITVNTVEVQDITVYSLGVEKFETYISNGIVTHNCPSAHACPLYQEDVHVLEEPCPIESKIVYELMLDLAEELEIDPNSRVEMGMVRDLVDQEIQQIRKQNLLATEDVIQENVVGVSAEGEPVLKKELHLGITWGDKIHKTKSSTLKQLLATRESRFKAGAQVASDAVTMSKVLAEYQRQDKMANSDILKKLEMGEEIKDDYIEAQIVAASEEDEREDDR